MHKDVNERVSKRREQSIKAHNKKTNIQPVNFSKGHFVLARSQGNKGHKLGISWKGPQRIREVKSDLVYLLEDFVSGKTSTVHASRMTRYRADMEGKEVDPKLLTYVEHVPTLYQDVENFHGLREAANGIEIQVDLTGLPEKGDFSWEPVKPLLENVPGILIEDLMSPAALHQKQSTLHSLQNA